MAVTRTNGDDQWPVTCMRCTWAYADVEIEMSDCSQSGMHLWKSAHGCMHVKRGHERVNLVERLSMCALTRDFRCVPVAHVHSIGTGALGMPEVRQRLGEGV